MAENHIQPDIMAVNSVDHDSSKPTQNHNVEDSDMVIKGINVNHQNLYDPGLLNTRKKSSFQITRVITKSGGSDHADGDGDDDLDETNTEEVSSDLLDISKTTDTDHDPPSEDTLSAHSIPASSEDFQKEINSSHIPSSSSTPQVSFSQAVANQVGFQPSLQTLAANSSIQTSSVPNSNPVIQSDNQSSINSQQQGILPDKSAARFKVVKIESREPFRRGRWSCLDYLTPDRSEKAEKTEKGAEEVGSGSSSAASSVHFVPGVDDPARNPLLEGSTITQNGDYSNQVFNGNQQQTYSNGTHIMPNASMPSQHNPTQVPTNLTQTQTHMQNVLPQASLPDSHPFQSGQSAVAVSTGNGQTTHGQTAQSQSSFSQNSAQAQISPPQSVMQQTQQTANSDSEFIPQQTEYIPQNTSTKSNAQQPQEMSSQSQAATSGPDFNSSSKNSVHTNGNSQQNMEYVQQQQTVPSKEPVSNTSPSNETVHYPPQSGESVQDFNEGQQQPDGPGSGGGFVNSANPEQNAPATSDSSEQKSDEFSSKLSAVQLMGLDFAISQKTDDEGGASTVAIDNKIEQAMDLVKSHLMYAVREEVEVLREQIKELLEKNSQLEYENQILKNAASPETLAKLSAPRPHSITQAAHGQAPPATSSS